MRARERNCKQLSFLAIGNMSIPFLLMSRTFHGNCFLSLLNLSANDTKSLKEAGFVKNEFKNVLATLFVN